MPPNDIYQIIGLIGAMFYIIAYFLLQIGVIRGQSYTYTGLNLIASSMVAVSLVTAFNSASLVIQATWIVISLYGLQRIYRIRRGMRFTDEERAFLDAKLPTITAQDARDLLDHGFWINGQKDALLTRQGEPIRHLIYLQSGTASVELNGVKISTLTSGNFVGEVTCLTGEPATATVRLDETARYLCIDAFTVRALAKRSAAMHVSLELSFGAEARSKLINASGELQYA